MRGGRVCFIGRATVTRVSYCSCHVAILSATWKFVRVHSFLTRFLKAILEVFWYSKWVMQYIVGKRQMSTFQWYKVCANRSLEGKVMTPGSRGVELFFRIFPVKIPAKRGKPPANRELHVIAGVSLFPTHLSSWIKLQRAERNLRAKAIVREEKRIRFSTRFPYFSSMFACMFDLAPDVGF